MKKTLLFLLVFLPFLFIFTLFYVDKQAFLCPVAYKRDFIVRSDGRGDGFFGSDRSGRRTHKGLDLLGQVGTPVLAARSGRVIAARQNNGMGKFVVIEHSGGIATLYGHLSEIWVREGQYVRQGQLIGAIGKTGNANSSGIMPHLHFEVRKNGAHQDPLEYLE
jgi:murein DD-endopeptidase MepM/ murein hydrolase activator NlpD